MYHADLAGALSHFGKVRDAIGYPEPSRALADCLSGRSVTLSSMGRTAEAAEDARRSLVVARELGYPAGEAKALAALSIACRFSGDFNGAVQLSRQAVQIPGDVPGWIYRANLRVLTFALSETGDLAAAERSCAAGLVRRRDEALARARQVLGEARARAAEDRGAAMSPATATEYALMLTAPDPQPKPPGGLAGLSARERELVTLVARGRTDAQIAGQLAISIRTVRSHLDRIRDKTGCRRRADLTRLALNTGLV